MSQKKIKKTYAKYDVTTNLEFTLSTSAQFTLMVLKSRVDD